MNLLQDFYQEKFSTFASSEKGDFYSDVVLNPGHPIYKGHFEQIPVVPGVCLSQIIQELMENKIKQKLVLVSGDNIKFLAPVNPRESPELRFSFQLKTADALYSVTCTVTSREQICMKFKGSFKPEKLFKPA